MLLHHRPPRPLLSSTLLSTSVVGAHNHDSGPHSPRIQDPGSGIKQYKQYITVSQHSLATLEGTLPEELARLH